MDEKTLTRFLAKVSRADRGCWTWRAASTPRGYGQLGVGSIKDGTRRMAYAHRLSYEHFVGPIPDGMEVCHRCDNPSCVNPSHLFAASHADNMRDMRVKNRDAHSDRHGSARLTLAQATAIFARRRSGETAAALANEYGVSTRAVSDIASGRRWARSNLPRSAE